MDRSTSALSVADMSISFLIEDEKRAAPWRPGREPATRPNAAWQVEGVERQEWVVCTTRGDQLMLAPMAWKGLPGTLNVPPYSNAALFSSLQPPFSFEQPDAAP